MMMEEVRRLVDLNNQFYPGMLLSLSMGAATNAVGERLEDVVRRADFAMYEAKREFYSNLSNDRRQRDELVHPVLAN
jgi:GGDEF domain-containing protein